MANKLTDKQEKFVQELIKGKSQREAYREAYPRSKKWTDNAVDVNASKIFNNTKVQLRYNEIHDRMIQEAEEECIFDGKRILQELAKIAFADRTGFAEVVTTPKLIRKWDEEKDQYVYEESKNYVEQYVRIKDTDQLTVNQRAVISGIKNTRHGISVETYDKQAALMALGKAARIFVDRIEVTENKPDPFEDLTTEELKKLIDGE